MNRTMTPPAPPPVTRSGRTGRTVWIVLASVATVLALAWGLIGVLDLMARSQTSYGDRFPAAGVSVVEVDVPSGRVTVAVTGGSEITADIVARRGLFANDVTRVVEDGRLVINSDCSGPLAFGWCSTDVTLRVPSGVSVVAHSSHGEIEVVGLTGGVTATSSSGDILVRQSAGPMLLRTSHGDIEATELAGGDVDANTSSGHIRLALVVPAETLRLRSSHGDIDVTVPDTDDEYRLELSSSHGDVDGKVNNNPTSDRTITAHTSSGHVTVSYQ
jgi:hypothetical protein